MSQQNKNQYKKRFSQEQWETLVDTLRIEVQEYGALLNLIQDQQKFIMSRDTESLVIMTEQIDEQTIRSRSICERREQLVNDLARSVGLKEKTILSDLLDYFPEKIQALLQAFVEEIQTLFEKTQYKARQNHMLLSRAYEVTEQLIRMLRPTLSKTYNKNGAASFKISDNSVCISISG
ncbi:MAG: hypothetical protein A2007_05950 [Verrucomicrobia bacterium GWC2_42_7]|nr:MAG: hypothetical protein A2007_05950 [Verrucomicrobia bacterium GWC2_42_7]